MRTSITIPGVTLMLMLLAFDIYGADPPAAPGKPAGPTSPRTVGVETPAQAKSVHAARAKLDIAPGNPPVESAAPGVLSNDQLLEMLQNMGYDMKVETYPDGKKYAMVTFPRNSWTFNLAMEVGNDSTHVWMRAYLVEWTEAQQRNPDRLLKLITTSHAQWPSYFVFFHGKYLYLQRTLPNVNVKPAMLRKAMEACADSIQNTQADWDNSKWTDGAPAAPPATEAKK